MICVRLPCRGHHTTLKAPSQPSRFIYTAKLGVGGTPRSVPRDLLPLKPLISGRKTLGCNLLSCDAARPSSFPGVERIGPLYFSISRLYAGTGPRLLDLQGGLVPGYPVTHS